MKTPTIYDDRAAAYVGAREAIKAAQKLKVDRKNRVVEPLPELYWALLAEAAVLADLARADMNVGLLAGGYLVDQQRRIEENRARFAQVAKAAAEQRHPHRAAADAAVAATFAVGMRVRMTTGDWAGLNGTITAAYLRNEPPMLDVQLDLPPDALFDDKPTTITVRVADIELDGVGFVR